MNAICLGEEFLFDTVCDPKIIIFYVRFFLPFFLLFLKDFERHLKKAVICHLYRLYKMADQVASLSGKKARPTSWGPGQIAVAQNKCLSCTKTVYEVEKLVADGTHSSSSLLPPSFPFSPLPLCFYSSSQSS